VIFTQRRLLHELKGVRGRFERTSNKAGKEANFVAILM